MQEKLKNICTATGRMLMLLQIAILIMIKLPGKYRQDKNTPTLDKTTRYPTYHSIKKSSRKKSEVRIKQNKTRTQYGQPFE